MSVLGVALRRKLADSKTWPKTTGEIVRCSIRYERSNRQSVVCPDVAYKYTVEGVEYVSTRLALVEINTSSEELAEGKAAKYSRGQLVDVYYNPKKPDFAVLTVGDSTQGKFPFGMIIVGVVAIIAGVVWAGAIGKHQIDVPNGHLPLERPHP